MRAEILEHRRKWVAALKSGTWDQVHGALAQSTISGGIQGYCCLGVASELARIPKSIQPVAVYWGQEYATGYLPREAMAWLGVRVNNPRIRVQVFNDFGDPYIALSQLNDEGYSFREIGALLEEGGIWPADDMLVRRKSRV
jgi:hypothetical protein